MRSVLVEVRCLESSPLIPPPAGSVRYEGELSTRPARLSQSVLAQYATIRFQRCR